MSRMQKLLGTTFVVIAVLASGMVAAGAETTFSKTQMYVVEGKKMVLRNVVLTFNDSALLVKPAGKSKVEEKTIPYTRVKKAEYEFSAERRWAAAVIVSPLFLLSKSKKHWFTVVCKSQTEGGEDEEVVFRLAKKNYSDVLSAFEKSSGIKVKMEAPKK